MLIVVKKNGNVVHHVDLFDHNQERMSELKGRRSE